MGIFFNSNSVNKITSNCVFTLQESQNPYYFMFNEYVILLHIKPIQAKGHEYSFLELEKKFNFKESLNLDKEDEFKISVIKNEMWENWKKNITRYFAQSEYKKYTNKFKTVADHYKLTYSQTDIKRFIDKIRSKGVHNADRHEKTRVNSILKEEIENLTKKQ